MKFVIESLKRLCEHRWMRMGLAGWVLMTILSATVFAPNSQFESDTTLILSGASALRRCVDQGVWIRCPHVFRPPLQQFLPVLLVGEGTAEQVQALLILSRVSTVLILVTFVVVLRGSPGAAALAVAAWVSGYGLWYCNSTFGEALAACSVLLAVVACYRRRPIFTFVAMVFAALSKETAGLFLFMLGCLALLLDAKTSRTRRTTFIALVLGVGCGVILNALFNVFRYGTPLNADYLKLGYHVSGWKVCTEYFIAQWISPNGGVLLFAPLLCLVVGVVLSAPTPSQLHRWVVRAATCVPFAMAVGFAHWYSPMGWWGYGSRYLMPWLPSVLLIALLADGAAWARWAQTMGARRYCLLSVGIALLAVPHILTLADGAEYARFSHANPECPLSINVLEDPVGQARSMHCQLFPHWYILPLRTISHSLVANLNLVMAYITLIVYLLHRARTERE